MLTRRRAVRMGHRTPERCSPVSADRAVSTVRIGDDAGMTLVELVVGMTLMAMFGAVALLFFVGNTAQTDRAAEQALVGNDVRVASDTIGTQLRFADTPTARAGFATGRFEVLTPTRIVFYSNLSTTSRAGTGARKPPSKIDISLVNGQLVEKIYAPKVAYTTYPSSYDYTSNYPTTPTTTMTLVRALVNQTLATPVPVFTYCTSATEPAVTCTPAANANAIAAVGVQLVTPAKAGRTPQRLVSTFAVNGAVS